MEGVIMLKKRPTSETVPVMRGRGRAQLLDGLRGKWLGTNFSRLVRGGP